MSRFKREARAASALNDPNILTIHEIGELDGTYFIATEFIDGQTLRQRMGRRQMKLGEILDVAIQTAGALAQPTRPGSCIGTSSRKISWCAAMARSKSSTLG